MTTTLYTHLTKWELVNTRPTARLMGNKSKKEAINNEKSSKFVIIYKS